MSCIEIAYCWQFLRLHTLRPFTVSTCRTLAQQMFGGAAAQRAPVQHLQMTVSISFLDAIKGVTKDLDVDYTVMDASRQPRRVKKTLTVKIPPGVEEGTKIRLAGR